TMDSEETSPKPDNRLDPWLEDGNVVLAAEDKFFRVHRSVLSASSLIFKDMFALPQPPADSEGEDEKLDGCPVVRLQDRVVDLQHVLKALYGSASETSKPMAVGVVTAFLRLGKKYGIAQLYGEAYEVVKGCYPTTLPAGSLSPRRQQPDRKPPKFGLINIAREVGLTSVLPVALYRCSLEPMSVVLHGFEWKGGGGYLSLSPINQKACILGRDRSGELLAATFKWVTLKKPPHQRDCGEFKCMLGMCMMALDIWTPGDPECDPFMPWAQEWDSRFCESCLRSCKQEHKEGRAMAWAALPVIYGLGTWEEVQKNETVV
ncbi:hypothetical protein HYDPIDRAFT_103486, partial [Hydnomerulius pinastri MD-312]